MTRLLPFSGSGKAASANCVTEGKARFSVLSQGLIRMEYSESGAFEDRSSYFAVNRGAVAQEFSLRRSGGALVIETSRLRLSYFASGGAFSASSLSVSVLSKDGDEPVLWRPGMAPTGNLGGTLRTLDEVEGPRDLGLGFLSRDGWSLIDDSQTVLFSDEETPWAEGRPKDGKLDWYFFGYGLDYKAALGDMTALGGKIPLPPRFALGSWYSRYWPYTSEEFLAIADEYKKEGFPLDVMVIDMDWHEDGWTGYTWNKKLIPDPKALLKELHGKGLKVTLNLHPHDGVGSHEKTYAEFSKAMGLGADGGKAVPFDITDRKFAEGYFRVLLNPLEEDGVDFWWMDWQQGSQTKVEGLDPLMWLNYLHFRDRQRPAGGAKPPRRGLNFSRWAGLGDHRHPVHFSGDTHSNWEVLEFLTPFTATAGNVGAAYWSHDMGGHFATTPRPNPELFTRWLQFGAFSPVQRVHSTRDKDADRRPWLCGEPWSDAVRKAYVLREQLEPYIYSAARACYDSSVAPMRPMYLSHPREARAYEVPGQFMFGEDLLVVPASRPGFGKNKVVHVAVWFPAGDWYHVLTHQRFQGPLETVLALPLDGMAVFARGGAAIPMKGGVIRLYPGPSALRELYEDDGESNAYLEGQYRRTTMSTRSLAGGKKMEFSLGPALGGFEGASERRGAMRLELPGSPSGDLHFPENSLHSVVSVALPAALSPEVAMLRDACVELLGRLALASSELERGAPLEEARGLKSLLEHLLELLGGPQDLPAWRTALETVRRKEAALLNALSKAKGDAESAALRIMAGISLNVMAKPTADRSKICIEIELLRAKPRPGSAKLLVKASNRAADLPLTLALDGATKQILKIELPVSYGSLETISGSLDFSLEQEGLELSFSEGFEWKALAIRDWLVLGPLEKGSLSVPGSFSEALSAEMVYPMQGSGQGGWIAASFSPAGMMRGIREFYDFGDTFVCPKGEAWAVATLVAAKACEASLGFGHEGEGALWLNGAELLKADGVFKAQLKEGDNQVIVRLSNMIRKGGGFGVTVQASSSPLSFRAPDLAPQRAATVS